jgi:glutaminyl-peptide cyclotransferase
MSNIDLKYVYAILLVAIITIASACSSTPGTTTQSWQSPTPSIITSRPAPSISSPVPTYGYKVIHTYPHDQGAFTEGLVYDDSVFYESTGRYGQSSLRKVNQQSGQVLQIYNLPAEYFGEGLALYQDKLLQLTWKSHTGFIYDKASFDLVRDFTYPNEGWGLTYDGKRLVMSDGTSTLHFWNPETLEEIGSIDVQDRGTPVTYLNELEYIRGQIYANVWQTNKIAIIDPESGVVAAWIDLTGIIQAENYTEAIDVLNGIAYDTAAGRLFVTGKLWPLLFEIEVD